VSPWWGLSCNKGHVLPFRQPRRVPQNGHVCRHADTASMSSAGTAWWVDGGPDAWAAGGMVEVDAHRRSTPAVVRNSYNKTDTDRATLEYQFDT